MKVAHPDKPVAARIPHPLNADKTVSRSYYLRLLRRMEGLCVTCPEPRDPSSANFCRTHLEKHRQRNRQALGCQAWEPGAPGRTPNDRRGED